MLKAPTPPRSAAQDGSTISITVRCCLPVRASLVLVADHRVKKKVFKLLLANVLRSSLIFFGLSDIPFVEVAAFPGSSGCKTAYYGNDLPAFGSGSAGASAGQVLVNSRPHDYVTKCDAKGKPATRKF